jgi:vancomycin resistance protein VanW
VCSSDLEVFERNHLFRHEWWGGYSRHNEIWRKRLDGVTGAVLAEEFLTENHAIMMYEPLLPGTTEPKPKSP